MLIHVPPDVDVLAMDVHKNTISTALLEPGSHRPVIDKISTDDESIRRLVGRFETPGRVWACYEAGPTGYELSRTLRRTGMRCEVIAPSLIPARPGDRIKTDRRDASRMALLFRAGQLSAVRVPTVAEEAVRDLCRARADMVIDQTRARHRLGKFLLRHGRVWRDGTNWTLKHEAWIAAHMAYSTAPENTPHGWNPVAWALFRTHHGWCAVTAIAFAEIWAWQTDRTTAIATGYLVHPSGVVRIKDAHAWVQLVTLIHAPAGTSSPYAIDPTMVLHRVPPAPAPSPAVPLALVGVLALAVATPIWLHRRNPLRRLERRARHQLGRPRRPDEALGAYATAAGLDPTPAWRVWDAASRRR